MQIHVKRKKLWIGVLAAATLTACSDDNDSVGSNQVEEASFRVTVTNLSAAQPISPVGVVLHDGSHQFWTVGGTASDALEQLAEGGNNQPWLDNAIAEGAVTTSGVGPIGPGGFETIEITGDSSLGYLTVAGMLVNTNDAFGGVQQLDVGALVTGDTLSRVAMVYDAGTEDNSEQASTFPGPASGGGEGFNSARDDLLDAVRIHAGVISAYDGLANSALDASHRFDNPGIRVQVERL